MDHFSCYQTSPNSLHYRGVKESKHDRKVIEGDVRTLREEDFNYEELSAFAEDGAYYALNPPHVTGSGINSAEWKGMHRGSIGNRFGRKSRKTHSERRNQIVARCMAENSGKK